MIHLTDFIGKGVASSPKEAGWLHVGNILANQAVKNITFNTKIFLLSSVYIIFFEIICL
jgi:hypothetical protein